jgi:hypothetical protein
MQLHGERTIGLDVDVGMACRHCRAPAGPAFFDTKPTLLTRMGRPSCVEGSGAHRARIPETRTLAQSHGAGWTPSMWSFAQCTSTPIIDHCSDRAKASNTGLSREIAITRAAQDLRAVDDFTCSPISRENTVQRR